jgi:4-hydroxybenzoate polyprenyltransferase
MFLNDAFDIEFDRRHRAERPIPSKVVSLKLAWILGGSWLGIGVLLLAFLGFETFFFGLLLIAAVLLYDATHKVVTFSPVLMACCRVFLMLTAGSAAEKGLQGSAVWWSFVLGFYIIGLSYLAKRESTESPFSSWPMIFLLSPLVLAFIENTGPALRTSILQSMVFCSWLGWCLRNFWTSQRNIGYSVSGLLAGIILVDWIALNQLGGIKLMGLFLILFLAARIFQRYIPAT